MPKDRTPEIELMLKQGKSNAHILMNTCLLLVSFAIFALVITKDFNLLRINSFLTMQLMLSIPFLLTSTLANSKLNYTLHEIYWDSLGWGTFIMGYAFLLNSIGILISDMIGSFFAVVFLIVTIALSLVYSAVEVSYNRESIGRRIVKDLIFITLIFLLGITPVMS
jgi:hypothetical protein